MPETDLFIELREISKRFPGVVANDRISLQVATGEIHALVGENGAGKSTLMRILYGLYQPDEGEIRVKGRPTRITSPRTALALGIGMVHQHFMLIPRFTVAENVILGSEPVAAGRLAMGHAIEQIEALTRQYEFALNPREFVENLSVGEQQRVEIIKVLYRGAELLILDEPTAVLVPQEVDELFSNLRRLREQGKTIIFISHQLEEVLGIADRITVLRRGNVVGTVEARATTKAHLAEMMVGRPVLLEIQRREVPPGAVRLAVDRLVVRGARGRPVVRNVTLQVSGGEIYGIAGVQGNGQTELVEALVGLRPITDGTVRVDGEDVTGATVRAIRLLGLAHIPEDRHRRGLVLPMETRENLILGHHHRAEFTNGPLLDPAAIDAFAQERIGTYDIRVPATATPALALSGGNQQKVIVAREFAFNPRVLVAAQPTRGLDIGATEFVEQQLMEAKGQGMAVLLVSANLDEVLTLADRVGVMYRGELVAEFRRGEATPQELGLYMTGTKQAGRDVSAAEPPA
jgi:simple sugar transport system ATP-binding protein